MDESTRDPRPDHYAPQTPAPRIATPWADHGTGEQTFAERRLRTDRDGEQQRREAMRLLGPVVYAARVADGLVKIGHTANLPMRLNALKGELLAFRPGTLADEQAIHAAMTDHVHHGREWYYPTPGVMAVVNAMRADLGLEPVAA